MLQTRQRRPLFGVPRDFHVTSRPHRVVLKASYCSSYFHLVVRIHTVYMSTTTPWIAKASTFCTLFLYFIRKYILKHCNKDHYQSTPIWESPVCFELVWSGNEAWLVVSSSRSRATHIERVPIMLWGWWNIVMQHSHFRTPPPSSFLSLEKSSSNPPSKLLPLFFPQMHWHIFRNILVT